MFDVSYPIRSAYYNLLEGAIQYDSQVVPYFSDYAGVTAAAPYMVFNGISISPWGDKSRFGFRVLTTVDIVSVFGINDTQTAMQAEMIANDALRILLPQVATGGTFDLGANFQNVITELGNSLLITERNDTEKVYRKVIQLNHKIKQIKNG